jgi:serine phosphatase RsbU (regulator of sigma subunit)
VYGNEAELINGESGLPLGLAESVYGERVVELKHSVKLLIYTDGISEAENQQEQEFGTRRIIDHMLREGSSAESLLRTVSEYAVPSDDATVILLRYNYI